MQGGGGRKKSGQLPTRIYTIPRGSGPGGELYYSGELTWCTWELSWWRVVRVGIARWRVRCPVGSRPDKDYTTDYIKLYLPFPNH